MFPNPDYLPAELLQALIGVAVPRHIDRELPKPPLAIRLWDNTVFGARMPEAAVDKYGNLGPRERYIDPPLGQTIYAVLHSITQPSLVELPAQGQLRASAGTALL